MHSAAGYFLPTRESVARWVNKLWDAPGAERSKVWARSRRTLAADKTVQPLLTVTRLRETLLERAAEAPLINLDRACDLIQLTKDPLHPLPAEAHFLLMLQRDLPGWNGDNPPIRQRPDLLKQAIRVRMLAERAAVGKAGIQYHFREASARRPSALQ